jgi:hypothetical protein
VKLRESAEEGITALPLVSFLKRIHREEEIITNYETATANLIYLSLTLRPPNPWSLVILCETTIKSTHHAEETTDVAVIKGTVS